MAASSAAKVAKTETSAGSSKKTTGRAPPQGNRQGDNMRAKWSKLLQLYQAAL
jgi:hypothetical protein